MIFCLIFRSGNAQKPCKHHALAQRHANRKICKKPRKNNVFLRVRVYSSDRNSSEKMQKFASKTLLETRCILYAICPRFWTLWGLFWDPFGTSWVLFGASSAPLGVSWAPLGRLLDALGAILDALGALLGRFGRLLGRSGEVLGRSQALLDDSGSIFKPLRVDFEHPRSRFGTPQRSVECRRSQ